MSLSDQSVCEAIWSQTLQDHIAELNNDAQQCLERIHAETKCQSDAFRDALLTHGVAVRAIDIKPQYHAFDLHIDPNDVASALQVAAQKGFVLASAFGKGAATALSRFQNQLALMKRGTETLRMTLIWRRSAPVGRFPAKLTPKLVDYGFTRLPSWAWWAYPMVKPLRVLSERVTGRTFEDRMNGYLAQVNLGTPAALLPPLCDFAGIGANDVLLDIGCGDARFLIDAARETGCTGIGVERNRPLAKAGQAAVTEAGLADKITIHPRLATEQDLDRATVIFMFQPPGTLRNLLPWALQSRATHTRVLVHEQAGMTFPTAPDVTSPLFGENALTVAYLWRASDDDK